MLKSIINPYTKEVICAMQIERKKTGDMYRGKFYGFNSNDELIFDSFCKTVSLKLMEFDLFSKYRISKRQFNDAINMIIEFLSNKTLEDFSYTLKVFLSKYFNFEQIGILIYNEKGYIIR